MDRLSELQVRSEQMKREMALYETKLHGKDQHDGEVSTQDISQRPPAGDTVDTSPPFFKSIHVLN